MLHNNINNITQQYKQYLFSIPDQDGGARPRTLPTL